MDFKFGGDGRRIEQEGEGGVMKTMFFHEKNSSMAFTFYYRIQSHSHLLAGWHVVLLGLAIIVAMVTVTGCASSKYKLADKDTPPPIADEPHLKPATP